MAADTDSNQANANLELEELLSKAAAVVEILSHDPSIPRSASNSAWAALELIERAQGAHARLYAAA